MTIFRQVSQEMVCFPEISARVCEGEKHFSLSLFLFSRNRLAYAGRILRISK